MIVTFTTYVVRCCSGHPGAAGRLQHSIEDAEADAEEGGWLCASGTHLCPRCKAALLAGKPLTMRQRCRLMTA